MAVESMRHQANTWAPARTLPGEAYTSPEVFALERERIFFADWMAIGREEQLANPDDLLVADVAGESVIVTRLKDGGLRAFYNSCAHRGTKLCDDGPGHAKSGVIKCPYHAWTYTTDGRLVGTPNVHTDEGFDRDRHPLFSVAVDTWDGFIFVNLSDEAPKRLADWVREDPADAGAFERYGIGDLRVGARLEYEVRANWKIIIENYHECLHCPQVHPELVNLIPAYRYGDVQEDPDSWAVHLADGATSMTMDGRSNHPRLPGISDEDARCYYGAHLFPNVSLDLTSDCVVAGYLFPVAPDLTRCVEEFLFRPETIADPAFDPSDLVEFGTLVSGQDSAVCEREQRGVRSRGYRGGGVYPFEDRFASEFDEHYRTRMAD